MPGGLAAEFASQVKNYSDKKKLNALLIMFKWRTMVPAFSVTAPARGYGKNENTKKKKKKEKERAHFHVKH